MPKQSRFESKLISFVIIVLMLKFMYIIFDVLLNGDIGGFFWALFIIIVLFLGVGMYIASMFQDSESYSGVGGGSTTVGDEQFQQLLDKYEKLCDDFIEKKQFKKAAYIQLKLLKNPVSAAYILYDAGLYKDAAIIFLKQCDDKDMAAYCYQESRSYKKAIKLYKELEEYEAIGDIYMKMKDTEKAYHYYQMDIDYNIECCQYVKASLIYREKMNDRESASKLLVKCWRENKDAFNCLNNHLVHFESKKALEKEINYLYNYEVHEGNSLNFLQVLKTEFKRDIAPKENVQRIAYELISKNHKNSQVLGSLHDFVEEDSQIVQDIVRHRIKRK